MKAYNTTWIQNLQLRITLKELYQHNIISKIQLDEGMSKLEVGFYKPNWFIRIGLFVFTSIAVSFTFGLLYLASVEDFKASSILLFLFGVLSFVLLEMSIPSKKLHHSGIDNALLYIGSGLIYASIISDFSFETQSFFYALLLLIILIPCVVRYADPIITLVAGFAVYALLFYGLKDSKMGQSLLPFVCMFFSGLQYLYVSKSKFGFYYKICAPILKAIALLMLILSSNYFVIRELNASILEQTPSREIALAPLFWALTFITPLGILYLAIKQKDQIALIIALLGLGFSIYTLRQYNSIMPLPWALCVGGTIIILLVIWAIKYFLPERHGISSKSIEKNKLQNLEGIMTGFLSPTKLQSQSNDFEYGGGGGFSGGGANESY
jgi:hypothetical protein